MTMKVWDVAGKFTILTKQGSRIWLKRRLFSLACTTLGQPKFLSMWERDCKDNDAIVYASCLALSASLKWLGLILHS